MSKKELEKENLIMRKHLAALHVFATGDSPGRNLGEFADQFPRTWNAIIIDNPISFDLPISGDVVIDFGHRKNATLDEISDKIVELVLEKVWARLKQLNFDD